MKVNSNMQAMIASNILKNNESRFAASTEKMSSGYRINSAKDSPSGMAITNRMNAQLKSLDKASSNSKNAINVIQTAEGSLAEMHDMVQRMNELSVKAANGTNSESDRKAIQTEIDQLSKEIERIAKDTEYNTQNLLGGEQRLKGYSSDRRVKVVDYNDKLPVDKGEDRRKLTVKLVEVEVLDPEDPEGPKIKEKRVEVDKTKAVGFDETGKFEVKDDRITYSTEDGAELIIDCDMENMVLDEELEVTLDLRGIGGMKIQVGSREGQEIQIVIPEISLKNIGIEGIDVTSEKSALEAIEKCEEAISYISNVRSKLGAYQNRFESTVSSLGENQENLTSSYATIKDIDMAEEMVNYTTLQVLTQAGTSMLSQANDIPQMALQLLQ